METLVLALFFTTVTGDKTPVTVNVDQIVSVRDATIAADKGMVQKGIRCIIHTADGKFIPVLEPCSEVRRKMEIGQ